MEEGAGGAGAASRGGLVTVGRAVFFLSAIFLLAVFAAAVIHHELGVPRSGWADASVFEVEEGETFDQVIGRLESEEILRPSVVLPLWARLKGWDRKLRAGRYEIGPGMAPVDILRTLVEGPRLLQRVTLPEGLALPRSLAILSDSLRVPLDSLWAAARDTAWILSLGLPVPSLEGYLFPETYHLDPGVSARSVLAHLVRQHDEVAGDKRARAAALGLTWHEAVTLASIIEAEARLPEERPRISAVFHNRLRRGLPLQADPTVQYAVGKIGEELTRADLNHLSPYNTYLVTGLPPGPINSPGEAALEAAVAPLEGSSELYFVAHPEGSHIFSRTLEEHERARRRMRQLKREQAR